MIYIVFLIKHLKLQKRRYASAKAPKGMPNYPCICLWLLQIVRVCVDAFFKSYKIVLNHIKLYKII